MIAGDIDRPCRALVATRCFSALGFTLSSRGKTCRSIAQPGRAPALGAGCRGFESLYSDHSSCRRRASFRCLCSGRSAVQSNGRSTPGRVSSIALHRHVCGRASGRASCSLSLVRMCGGAPHLRYQGLPAFTSRAEMCCLEQGAVSAARSPRRSIARLGDRPRAFQSARSMWKLPKAKPRSQPRPLPASASETDPLVMTWPLADFTAPAWASAVA